MIKSIRKIVLICLICMLSVLNTRLDIYAASISVSTPETGTVSPGQSFSVTINVGNLGGQFNISASGGFSVSESGFWSEEGGSKSITVTAPSSGSGAIHVSGSGLMNFDTGKREESERGSSQEISVVQPTPPSGGGNSGSNSGGDSSNGGTTTPPPVEENPKSSNNLLGGITLSTGVLSPEFSGDQTEYTVTMPADATSINILASTQDDTATVSGIGDHTLNAGLNSIVLSVTAENGEIRNYTINVHVDEKPLIFTDYGENKLGVVRNLDEIGIPDSFEETTVKINDQEVKAWKSNLLNKTIVFMSNETGDKSFYVYEDGKGITSKITPMGLLGRNVYILDISKEMQVMEGFTYGEVTIDDKKMMGWTFNNPKFKNYALIYVMKDNGEMVFYQYESTEKSLQVYSGAVPYTQTELDEINKNNTNPILLYGLIGGVVVSLGIAGYAIYQLIRTKKYYSTNREGINQVDEYDDFEG